MLKTGEATWDEGLLLFLERSGYPEETYHTFSYSPLADDTGGVSGMLCVVTEETERVIGERRLGRCATWGRELGRQRQSPTRAGSMVATLGREPARRAVLAHLPARTEDGATAALCASRASIRQRAPRRAPNSSI